MARPKRIDGAELCIDAPPERIWEALISGDAVAQWLPPESASGRVERYEAHEGGAFEMVLTFDGPVDAKSGKDSDRVVARFGPIEPGRSLEWLVEFDSDEVQYKGRMRMRWQLEPRDGATLVSIRASDVPRGIEAATHREGLASSLRNLAAYLAR